MVDRTALLEGAEHQNPRSDDESARPRDADDTRRRLLQAARHRFAHHGYSGTTVRDIAADAGVNVALINRYFTSKEGLFEACLQRVVEDLDRPANLQRSVSEVVESMISQLVDSPTGDHSLQLMLLLRSSADVRADQIRRNTLLSFAEGIATIARGQHASSDDLLLRAEIALSIVLGILLVRSSTGLEPLSSATATDLRGPLGDALASIISP